MENTPGENNNEQPQKPDQVPPAKPEGETPAYAEPEKPAFGEPKVLTASIDPKQKPEQPKTAFSFTNPSTIHQHSAQPTKGEAQQKQQSAEPSLSSDEKLKKLDQEIANDAKDQTKYTFDDYQDTAEMFVEGWEGIVQFAALLIDKNGSPSSYQFLEEKKKKLIHLGTKVSRKRGWVITPEVAFLGTLIPITARTIIKATDGRKAYMAKRRQEEEQNRPPEVNKGGPNKGEIKTRGPGRPRKG